MSYKLASRVFRRCNLFRRNYQTNARKSSCSICDSSNEGWCRISRGKIRGDTSVAIDGARDCSHNTTTAPPNPPPVNRAPRTPGSCCAIETRRSNSRVLFSKFRRELSCEAFINFPNPVPSPFSRNSTARQTRSFSSTTCRARRRICSGRPEWTASCDSW